MTDTLITQSQLDALEAAADKIFGKLGIDIEFTRHFLDRVNDERNIKQITLRELGTILAKEYRRWGRTIAKLPFDSQAVMKDLSNELNIPFVLNKDGKGKDLVAKTIMRKKNFNTSDREFPVESVTEDSSEDEVIELVKSAIAYLRKRSDSLDTVAIMKKGNAYNHNDTQAPGFQQKLNRGWTVVAYVKSFGKKIQTDGAHKFLQTLVSENVTEDHAVVSNTDFLKGLRNDGWSVYVSKIDHRVENAHRVEFEKDDAEFEIIGKKDKWELYTDGATLSGRGSMHASLEDAFNASQENIAEADIDKPKYDIVANKSGKVMDTFDNPNFAKMHYWVKKGWATVQPQNNKPVTELDTLPLDVKTLTTEVIADKHGVDLSMIEQELKKGTKAEMKHTSDKKIAMENALNCLAELPNYYSKVPSMNETLTKGAWEVSQLRERIRDPREQILRKALTYLDDMIKSNGDKQSIGGYAFDIARAFNLKDIITARELAQLYNDWQAK
jgi:hypothetical protein